MLKPFSLGIFVVLSLLIGSFLVWSDQVFQRPLSLPNNEFVRVKTGSNFQQLCRSWQSQGVVEHCWLYRFYAKFTPKRFQLKAGVYHFSESATLLDAVYLINKGEQYQFQWTVIEGESLHQILRRLAEQPFVQQDVDIENLTQVLRLSSANGEGWLYPDTYYYVADTSALSLLKRAHQKMLKVLDQVWQVRFPDIPLESPYQALILASIIEKETGVAKERPLIASVFTNRLRKKMRLQTDPTVIYGLGASFDGDLKRRDLRQYTPYNTYRIAGLPPTPIAMPSQASLLAAVQPAHTDYYYFVAKGNGQHQFSKDLKAHRAAVARYILKEGL